MTCRDQHAPTLSPSTRTIIAVFALGLLLSGLVVAFLGAGPDPAQAQLRSPTLGAPPPGIDGDSAYLFNRRSWDGWVQRDGSPSQWEVQSDGSVLVKGGDAITAREYRDFQLHVEFRCPEMPEASGQARGNSGVYLHGRYEIQVLDSYGLAPADNGCGAIYGVAPPLVNASVPAGKWQTYDIVFRAPRFDSNGNLLEFARVTVLHNGVVIHNNAELPTATIVGLDEEIVGRGPVLLQDHGDPVRYRNIWIREL